MNNETLCFNQNACAIKMLDAGETGAAKSLFYKNYRENKTPMTLINLACYLADEHNMIDKNLNIFAIRYFRSIRAKRILNRCLKSFPLEANDYYHLMCLLGSIEVTQGHYDSAIVHYSNARNIKGESIEALSMLAWLLTLRHHYNDADTCLDKLANALKLGHDMEQNLNTIFEKCPFSRFPYYQLVVHVRSYIRPNESNELLHQMTNTTEDDHELLFPAEELALFCLYLKNLKDFEKIMAYISPDIQKNNDYYNAMLLLMKKINYKSFIIEHYKKIFKKHISKRYQYEYAVKRSKWGNDFDYLLSTHFYPSYKECHYVNCPIHSGETIGDGSD